MKNIAIGVLLALLPLTGSLQAAERQDGVIVETGPVEIGSMFGCRIPVEVSSSIPLSDISIIVRAYKGSQQLASSGVTLDQGYIRQLTKTGRVEIAPAPRQLEFSERDCMDLDRLRIVFAYCDFTGGKRKNCLDETRFRGSAPESPRHLYIDRIPEPSSLTEPAESDDLIESPSGYVRGSP